MSLPKNEKTFDFNHDGEITGKKYDGQFTVKCMLSMADKRAVEIERSRLTADLMNPTGNLAAMGTVVSNLRARVLDAPEWYKQSIITLDLLDEEVFYELYSKCLEASDSWLKELKDKAVEKSSGN